MKALDEILIGFLVFFLIERGLRLGSSLKYGRPEDTKVLQFEFWILVVAMATVMIFRRRIGSVNL
jgi:hypothetical protein